MRCNRLLLSVLLSAAGALACAQRPMLHLDREISLPGVEGRIDHLTVDLAGQRIFAAAVGNGTVEVVDLRQGRRSAEIQGLTEPQGILYLPGNHTLYVASGGDGSVRSYDGQTLKPIKTVVLGEDADNMRYDAGRGQLLAGYGNGAIGVLALDLTRRADLLLPAHPESFQIAVDGKSLFVNLPRNQSIARVPLAGGSVNPGWASPGAEANYPMALDSAQQRLFVACREPALLVAIDTGSGKIMQQIKTVGDADDLFYDSVRHADYVIGGEGFVDVVAVSGSGELTSIGHVQTGSGARTGLYVPEWNKLFIAAPHRGTSLARILEFSISAQ